jgi:hypothetical protein
LHKTQVSAALHFHDASLVAAAIAVVRGAEERHDGFSVVPHVPFHHQLVCSGNELHFILMAELLADILTKNVPST